MAEVMHVKATGSDASRRVDGRSRDGGQTGVGRLIGRGLDACRTGVTVWKSALRCVSDGLAAVFCVFAEIFYGGRGLNAKTAKSAKVNAKSVVKIFKSRRRDRNPFKISKNKIGRSRRVYARRLSSLFCGEIDLRFSARTGLLTVLSKG
jgi:hypothetical protein